MSTITKVFSNGFKVVSNTVSYPFDSIGHRTTMDVFKPDGKLLVRRSKDVQFFYDEPALPDDIYKRTIDFYPISQKGVKKFLATNDILHSGMKHVRVMKEIWAHSNGVKEVEGYVTTPYTGFLDRKNRNFYNSCYYAMEIDKSGKISYCDVPGFCRFPKEK